jgi:SAM-dependent methyltransferase
VVANGPAGVPKYDTIGWGYAARRRTDPRLAAMIRAAIGSASSVVNIGAGAGSYEPSDCQVVALEPSSVMLSQHHGHRCVQGSAEHLPFGDQAFDAAMAILTVHHWSDLRAGLAEMRRVSRRQVVFTWDPDHAQKLWITTDYVPAIDELESSRFATLSRIADALDAHTVVPFAIPHDFIDGFQGAFWRRPEMFLDPQVRAASSTFASLPPELVEPGIEQLRHDLQTGEWHTTYAELIGHERVDLGHRIVIAG